MKKKYVGILLCLINSANKANLKIYVKKERLFNIKQCIYV